MASPHPQLTRFLSALNSAIDSKDGEQLLSLLPIEPPFNNDYHSLLDEVFSYFTNNDSLKDTIEAGIHVIAADDKDAWHSFSNFLVSYFQFIHSVDPTNLPVTYKKLEELIV